MELQSRTAGFSLEKTDTGIRMTSEKKQPLLTFARGTGNLRSGSEEIRFCLKDGAEGTIYGEGKSFETTLVLHHEDGMTAVKVCPSECASFRLSG